MSIDTMDPVRDERSVRRGVLVCASIAAFAWFAVFHAAVAHAVVPCGTRDGELREPTANDALFVLEAAVGLPGRCGLCLCDVDAGGSITVRDAVLVLQRATGAGAALQCPSCPCTARVRQPETYVYDFALADFNNDGLGELASHDGGHQMTVWMARGRGVLERSLEEHYLSRWRSRVVTADVDGDGLTDVVTNGEGYFDLVVLGGNGDGTFREPVPFLTISAEHILFEDLNGDDNVDLIASDYDPPSIVTRLGDGSGSYGPEIVSPVVVALDNIRIGDLDADEIPDLVGIGDHAPAAIVTFGRGDGTFGPPRALPVGDDPRDVEIGDFNDDGRTDIAIVDGRETAVRVYYGTSSSGFESPLALPLGGTGAALDAGDIDGDAITDLVVAQGRADIAILLGSAAGLQPAKALGIRDAPHRVALTDVDADGDLDLIALDGGVLVMLGTGDGGFVLERSSRATARTLGVRLGDVDADGVDDLITADDASVSAYPGNGSGDFGSRVLTALDERPRSSFAADVGTDGFADFVITAWAGLSESGESLNHVSVLPGSGDGRFGPPETVADLATSIIAHGDIDGDGRVDFAALVYDPARIEIYVGDGVGGFASTSGFEIGSRADRLFLLDADGDGHLDLLSLTRARTDVFLWLGNGDTNFSARRSLNVGENTTDVVAADFDSDGHADLAFLNEPTGRFSLWFGNGRGVFAERPGYPPVLAGAIERSWVADFDGDGAIDIAYLARPEVSYYPNVAILPGDGRGGFRAPVVFSGRSGPTTYGAADFLVADIDGSGALDLLVGHDSDSDNNVTFLPDPGNCLLR